MSFLFEAQFVNGDIYQQTTEDKSTTTEGRNCFFDVLQRIDEVVIFGLFSNDCPDTWAVDLRTGTFHHNGVPFAAGDPSVTIPQDAKLRLVYFKRCGLTITPDGEQFEHPPVYHIGFQTNLADGSNYKQTISVVG